MAIFANLIPAKRRDRRDDSSFFGHDDRSGRRNDRHGHGDHGHGHDGHGHGGHGHGGHGHGGY